MNNSTVVPRIKRIFEPITLMWSTIATLNTLGNGTFKPNHFVPVVNEPFEPSAKQMKKDVKGGD